MIYKDLSEASLGIAEAACVFVERCMLICHTLHVNMPEAVFGYVLRWMWIGQNMHTDWSDTLYGFFKSCMWIFQKLYMDLLKALHWIFLETECGLVWNWILISQKLHINLS